MVFLVVSITFEPILDGFFRFWANPEIQDGELRWPPFRKYFVMCRHHLMMRTSKETFSEVPSTLYVSLS